MSSTLPPDPYNALGVGKSVTVSELRAAFRKLVIKFHPDKFTDEAVKPEKFEEFKKIQDTYEILSDESRRLQNDEQAKIQESSIRIEEGIKARNARAYQNLRQGTLIESQRPIHF